MQDIALDSNTAETGGGRKVDIILAAVAILLVGAASAWFLLGSSDVPTLDDVAPPTLTEPATAAGGELTVTATEGESVDTLTNKARMALSADMLAEPPGQNALYYYSLAVEADPDNTVVRGELDAVAAEVATLIRDYMAAQNWTAAEQLASRLELAVPQAGVLSEYNTTLDNRRQTLLDQAVAEASAGRARSAAALLDQARSLPGSTAASVRQTQQQIAAIADERREAAAARAAERASAERTAAAPPPAPATDAPPARAEAAAPVEAVASAPAAAPPAAPPADVTTANAIRAQITSGELAGDAGAIAALGEAFAEYPDSEALGSSADLLFDAVDSLVQRQLAGDDTRAAAGTIASIESLPGSGPLVADLRATLGDAERRLAGATVIPANQLQLVEAVPPVYPRSARRRELEGWVDVEFTVTSDGSTSDIIVVQSSSGSIFNRSTIQAVTQWRFKPRMFRGEPIDQRVTTRVGYRLQD